MEATTPCSHTVHMLETGATTMHGEAILINWKACVYTMSGKVFWEVRQVLHDFYGDIGGALEEKNFFRNNKIKMEASFAQLNLDFDVEFKPSFKSFCSKYPGAPVTDPYIREEYGVSTVGLLAWMMHWAHSRRCACERDRAVTILEAFLSAFFVLDDLDDRCIFDKVAECSAECANGADGDGLCFHIRDEIAKTDRLWPKQAPHNWRDSLSAMSRLHQSVDCLCLQKGTSELLGFLATSVDSGAPDRLVANPSSISFKRLKTAAGNYKRVDEHFKDDCAVAHIRDGKCRSAGQSIKVWSTSGESSGRTWERNYVLARNVAAKEEMPCERVLWISEDAGRAGQPKEETMSYWLYDCASKLSHVGAPMVRPRMNDRVVMSRSYGSVVRFCLDPIQHIVDVVIYSVDLVYVGSPYRCMVQTASGSRIHMIGLPFSPPFGLRVSHTEFSECVHGSY